MKKIWIYTEFSGDKIIRVELYSTISMIIKNETITDNGKVLNWRKLHDRLRKSVVSKATENRIFESDNFSITERPLKRAKIKVKELLKK